MCIRDSFIDNSEMTAEETSTLIIDEVRKRLEAAG